MNNLENVFLFVFILSILTTLRLVFKFASALLQNPPSRLELSGRELFFDGIMISYLITYILKTF
jgi:hypothetical protein